MKGIAYGVGVGPGDPELMTIKAVNIIKDNDVIALPGKEPKDTAAYRIAVRAVPELAEKELIPVFMPMTMDLDVQRENHLKGARLIESYLEQGRNVVYLTLGDASIYCTFSYLQNIIEEDGYRTELVSGIPSFCAAAARLNTSLVEWNESMHVIPALHKLETPVDQPGCFVLMKSGSHMKDVKDILRKSGKSVKMVENCGMPDEKVYNSLEEIPDEAGYFSLIIAK